MLIPNSLFIPPLCPNSLLTMQLFSTSMSLLLFCKQAHRYFFFFLDSTYKRYLSLNDLHHLG